jgi:hypothetical protein
MRPPWAAVIGEGCTSTLLPSRQDAACTRPTIESAVARDAAARRGLRSGLVGSRSAPDQLGHGLARTAKAQYRGQSPLHFADRLRVGLFCATTVSIVCTIKAPLFQSGRRNGLDLPYSSVADTG